MVDFARRVRRDDSKCTFFTVLRKRVEGFKEMCL